MVVLSKKYDILFLHIPKNAGSYIKRLLYKIDPNCDNIVYNFGFYDFGHQNIRRLILHDKDKLLFNVKNIFCIIRNPIDQFISFYYYLSSLPNHKLNEKINFNEYIEILKIPITKYKEYMNNNSEFHKKNFVIKNSIEEIRPSKFLYSTEKLGIKIHLINFNNLETNLKKFFDDYNINYSNINFHFSTNKNITKPKNIKINDNDLRILEETYADDFKLFNLCKYENYSLEI